MANSNRLSDRQSLWLLAAATAAFLPLVPYLPYWLGITTALVLIWRGALLWRRAPLPSRWLLMLAVAAGTLGIAIYYRTLLGRSPSIALVVLLFAMKTLEMRTARDGFALVLLAYFLVMTQFLFSQSIANAAVMLATVTLITASLTIMNHQRQEGARALRLAAAMLAQATPLMLLLFVLFPRVNGPLWGLPGDAYSGLTGLSDTMRPGSISQLGLSDAIAFRALFRDRQPAQKQLYWRGPVLSRFDGSSWSIARTFTRNTLPYAVTGAAGRAFDYSVTLEPHNKPWLFALELPGSIPSEGLLAADYQLLAKAPVRTRLRYEMRSYPDLSAGLDESPAVLSAALQLPPRSNPRARAMALAWRADLGIDDAALIQRMLDFYRRQFFSYTLSPPLLGEDSVDEFLFDSRRGFCEHFAASFVFMMRAAGIPARVVTGYQGGEINPVDGSLIVRQYDAHAWSEVWEKGRGWVRIDPTAAIAPSRIEANLAAALPQGEPLPFLARPEFLWLHELRYRWDALANTWNQWVLGYNPERQREFLAGLGMRFPDWQKMTIVMTALCAILLAGFAVWAVGSWRRIDPALAAWNRLSRKLERRGPRRVGGRGPRRVGGLGPRRVGGHGLARLPWEGPRDYAERVGEKLPKLAGEIRLIAAIYEQLRYGGADSRQGLKELKMHIRRL